MGYFIDNEQHVEDIDPAGEGDVEDEVEDHRANRLIRRQHTYNRKLHSIDTALDLTNYDAYEIPVIRREIDGVVKVDKNKDHDIHYQFANQPHATNVGRQNCANVIRGPQGFQVFTGYEFQL